MAHHQEIQERQEILFQFSHRELSIYMYQHFINPNKLVNWTDQVDMSMALQFTIIRTIRVDKNNIRTRIEDGW